MISDLRWDCSCWQAPPLIHHLSKYIKPDKQRLPHLRQQLLPSDLCAKPRGKAARAPHVPGMRSGVPRAPFRSLYHPQQPLENTAPSLVSPAHAGRTNPTSPNPKAALYHGNFTHIRTLRTRLRGTNQEPLGCAKAQEKLNDLSKMAPRSKIQEAPPFVLGALLPSRRPRAPRFTHPHGSARQNVCQRDREPTVG